jgi:hypothetical protein
MEPVAELILLVNPLLGAIALRLAAVASRLEPDAPESPARFCISLLECPSAKLPATSGKAGAMTVYFAANIAVRLSLSAASRTG